LPNLTITSDGSVLGTHGALNNLWHIAHTSTERIINPKIRTKDRVGTKEKEPFWTAKNTRQKN